ncbi:hypothetical protein [Acetobacter sp.]|uniref:hypothetical protein n=1 Tax=Acetobacter sp. TaxID=440 RepID=UPI0039E8DAAB
MPEYRHDYALWSRLVPDTPPFRALAHKWGLVCSGRSHPAIREGQSVLAVSVSPAHYSPRTGTGAAGCQPAHGAVVCF